MIWVGVGDMTEGAQPHHLNRLGGFLGVMTQSDASVNSLVPPQGDRDTAFRYGARVAALAQRLQDSV
jgi:NAD(P)H dehydrogenase (quinone)